jgi:hypothetical protein
MQILDSWRFIIGSFLHLSDKFIGIGRSMGFCGCAETERLLSGCNVTTTCDVGVACGLVSSGWIGKFNQSPVWGVVIWREFVRSVSIPRVQILTTP